jgi:hypothetical protein
MFGEFVDRIAAIHQDAFIAIDVGDLRFAAGGRGKARIVGERACQAVQLGNVDDIGADRAFHDVEFVFIAVEAQLGGAFGVRHDCYSSLWRAQARGGGECQPDLTGRVARVETASPYEPGA